MGKKIGQLWKKEGQSRQEFFQPWNFPQDIQGILIACDKKKVRGMGEQVSFTVTKNDGVPIMMKGSDKSALGRWIMNKKVGSQIRILYTGGSLKDGREIIKGIKNYKEFKKWKKGSNFYPNYEFFGK
jgi:hypothetical protein